jgi:hypothetical protein
VLRHESAFLDSGVQPQLMHTRSMDAKTLLAPGARNGHGMKRGLMSW